MKIDIPKLEKLSIYELEELLKEIKYTKKNIENDLYFKNNYNISTFVGEIKHWLEEYLFHKQHNKIANKTYLNDVAKKIYNYQTLIKKEKYNVYENLIKINIKKGNDNYINLIFFVIKKFLDINQDLLKLINEQTLDAFFSPKKFIDSSGQAKNINPLYNIEQDDILYTTNLDKLLETVSITNKKDIKYYILKRLNLIPNKKQNITEHLLEECFNENSDYDTIVINILKTTVLTSNKNISLQKLLTYLILPNNSLVDSDTNIDSFITILSNIFSVDSTINKIKHQSAFKNSIPPTYNRIQLRYIKFICKRYGYLTIKQFNELRSNIPVSASSSVPVSTSSSVPVGTSPSVPVGTSQSVPVGTSPSAPVGTSPSAPVGTLPSAPVGTSPSVAVDVSSININNLKYNFLHYNSIYPNVIDILDNIVSIKFDTKTNKIKLVLTKFIKEHKNYVVDNLFEIIADINKLNIKELMGDISDNKIFEKDLKVFLAVLTSELIKQIKNNHDFELQTRLNKIKDNIKLELDKLVVLNLDNINIDYNSWSNNLFTSNISKNITLTNIDANLGCIKPFDDIMSKFKLIKNDNNIIVNINEISNSPLIFINIIITFMYYFIKTNKIEFCKYLKNILDIKNFMKRTLKKKASFLKKKTTLIGNILSIVTKINR